MGLYLNYQLCSDVDRGHIDSPGQWERKRGIQRHRGRKRETKALMFLVTTFSVAEWHEPKVADSLEGALHSAYL